MVKYNGKRENSMGYTFNGWRPLYSSGAPVKFLTYSDADEYARKISKQHSNWNDFYVKEDE